MGVVQLSSEKTAYIVAALTDIPIIIIIMKIIIMINYIMYVFIVLVDLKIYPNGQQRETGRAFEKHSCALDICPKSTFVGHDGK